jgi:amidohydrolase
MHGCGHDAHATIAVGATLALANLEARGALPWPAPRRLILQHAEETAVGAQEMIDAGALYGVQGIFSLHVDPSRDVGSIGVRSGVLTAACDWLDVRIEGAGGHAARPHESTDPIAAAAQLISAIYALIPRSVDSHEPVVVTIGQISGGYSANVIPDLAHLKGTIRTLDSTTRAATIERLKKLARGIAEASGAEIHLHFGQGPPAVINDPAAAQTIRQAAAGVVGTERVAEIPRPSMGGEDFSHYLERVPGAMFRLGVRSPTVGREPLHSPLFDIDERALAIGAKILARAAVLWVNPERNSGARHGDEIQVIS